MKSPTVFAAMVLLAVAASAQEGRKWPLSSPWTPRPPEAPRLVVQSWPGRPGLPVELRRMEVRARIVGLQAEATATMTFFNPNPRLLEAELQFPLPDGAIVTGYALDVRGQMVDGVVVKKEKARVAFETEVRRGVDPGIIEHVAGNVYRTRVYPLPAQGERKIRIRWVAELPSDGSGDAACFLPMPIGEPVALLAIRVEVSPGAAKPEIGGFGNLRFERFENVWVAETELHDARPGEDIWVALPKLPPQVPAVERTADGDVYFAVSDLYAPRASSVRRPDRIGVAWDASGSRAGLDLKGEIAALKNLPTAASLLVFRDRPEPISPLTDPDSLEQIAYDGGTDLAAAADAVRRSDIHDWLLFTDGLDTLSGTLPEFGDKNVVAVVSQTVADREVLRRVCAGVVDLQRFDASAILRPTVRLARVHGAGIADVQGIGAAAHGRVAVHGRLTADEAELRLEYSDGRTSPSIRLSRSAAIEGTLLASVWAAERVSELAVRPDANEEEMLALGRRFGVVSPATSLIVLESLDQYLRHEIEPPASLPALRAQWQQQIAWRAKSQEQMRAGKLDRVLAMWRARVAWWESDFSARPDLTVTYPVETPGTPRQAPQAVEGVVGGISGGVPGGVVDEPPRRFAEETAVSSDASAAPSASRARAAGPAKAVGDQVAAGTTVTVKPWDPATPYLAALKAAAKADRYRVYLAQRAAYAASPAFFVDCAEFFMADGERAIGVRVLTNLAEMRLEEASLLRVLAWRLQQAGELDRAIVTLRRVARLRPEEPQSYRDLALALAEHGQAPEAMKLLAKVVMGEWDGRFPEIEVIALEELNAIYARTGRRGTPPVDPRLITNLDVDVRIVMSWDADATDVDLHVVEPSGEEAMYNHNRTASGGLVSRDVTQGYGPEEYMVRRAAPGAFRVFAHYYGSRQQTIVGPCTVTATVFTDFGRPTQKKRVMTLRLDKPNDRADIGEVRIAGSGKSTAAITRGAGGDATGPSARDAFRAIRVGERPEAVKRLVGEPQEKQGDVWTYRSGDRQYRVRFSDGGLVESVTEVLPGGAEMILAQ